VKTPWIPTTLRAICFDMDGLLVDTERLWFESEKDVMERLGGIWRPENQHDLVGGSLANTVGYMLRLSGSDADPDVVAGWLLDAMTTRLNDGVDLLPGARELLESAGLAGVPCALVSSSRRVLVDAVLAGFERDWFSVTISGDDVSRLKPNPEPYLATTSTLGVEPRHCVVLEDSPNGVASSEAAGCVTVAVPSIVPICPAPGRTVVASLRELSLRDLDDLVVADAV
jgi:HAD superfamily hydrolase (TIGR01509 family)